MLKLCETKVAKEEFHVAQKPLNIWDANVDNILISNLTEIKNNSKYLIGYLDKVIKPVFRCYLK